jgi:hypothetical protein
VRRTIVLAALFLAAAAAPSGAAIHHISPDGSGDFATIQAAVDAAVAGDTILLADGTFTGDGNRDIDFGGKDLIIGSEHGNTYLCQIDCEGDALNPHRAFYFHSGETRASMVLSIGITGGYAYDAVVERNGGGAFRIDGASPTIMYCVVMSCAAGGATPMGGGVSIVNGADPLIDQCWIQYCDVEGYGGGISIFGANATITSCTIVGNTCIGAGGGLYVQDAYDSEVQFCWFYSNIAGNGGGLRIGGSDIVVEKSLIEANEAFSGRPAFDLGGGGALLGGGGLLDCTVVGNSTTGIGGGVLCQYADDVTLTNCIVADNADGSGVACFVPADVMTLSCCDVWGNAEGDYGANMTDQTGVDGNISGDPLFCNVPYSDYTIDAASPCAPAHNTCGVYMGSDVVNCDSPVKAISWGAVKALFKR